jgi:hypothetical protein
VKAAGVGHIQIGQLQDPEKLKESLDRHFKIVQAAEDRMFEEIAADKSEVDQAVVELWRRLRASQSDRREAMRDMDQTPDKGKAEKSAKQETELRKQIAALVGPAVNPVDDNGESHDLHGCFTFGQIARRGRTVQVPPLRFRYPAAGLPAFGEWLARHCAGDIRYSCAVGADDDSDTADDDGE